MQLTVLVLIIDRFASSKQKQIQLSLSLYSQSKLTGKQELGQCIQKFQNLSKFHHAYQVREQFHTQFLVEHLHLYFYFKNKLKIRRGGRSFFFVCLLLYFRLCQVISSTEKSAMLRSLQALRRLRAFCRGMAQKKIS